MDNKALIAEKQAQIQALRLEIAELQTPTSLSRFCTKKPFWVDKDHETNKVKIKVAKFTTTEPWSDIRSICMKLVRPNHNCRLHERLHVRDLTHEEIKISARMADKMIESWNEAIIELYGPLPDSQ